MTPTAPSTPEPRLTITEAAELLALSLRVTMLEAHDELPLSVATVIWTPLGNFGLRVTVEELPPDGVEDSGARLELQAERGAQEIERREAAHDSALRVLWSRIFGR